MYLHPATAMRRFASTFLVLLALFVACAGVHAMPCEPQGMGEHAVLVDVAADALGDLDDQGSIPSLEDNSGGLDDTFDLPPMHAVSIAHLAAGRPPGLAPAPHAHHPSLDLRPPIA
jgi:hypothetical protein